MDTQEITVPQVASSKKADGEAKSKSLKENPLNSWQIVRLGEVCRNTTLINPGAYPEKTFTYLDVSSVSNESYSIIEAREILGKDAPSRARKLVQTDDVIFATVRPTLKRISMIPSELNGQVCSTGFCVLRANRKNLEPQYLYFLLLTEFVYQRVESLQKGATYPAISDTDLFNLLIPLPSISEQNTIAQVLQIVQEAVQARRDELELERECKAALMVYLFTHGTRGETTKQTEIGEIPESWDVMQLGKVAKIERGKFSHRPRNDPDFYGGETPFIQTGDVTASNGYIRQYTQTLNAKGLSVSRIFPKGTIVITIAANIGFTGILEFDSAFPDSLIGITPISTTSVEPNYLNYYLMTQQSEMDSKAPRGTQKNINIEFLFPWPTLVPPLEEQQEIVEVLTACNTKVAVLEQEIALLEELFRALLEELMTGRLSTLPLIEERNS